MRHRAITITIALTGLLAIAGSAAFGGMRSKRLEPGLCVTDGGGRFVDIPRFPGEMIDRRLKRDIRMLQRRYKIYVTDGYATSGHAPNGEHPIGLALDIVPDKAAGGSWRDITRLARWAEPRQNDPRPPFRWVGYDGDSGHGRGHHLHLSWAHSPTKPKRPARTVYTVRCPKRKRDKGAGKDQPEPKTPQPAPAPTPDGGTSAGEPTTAPASGGVSPRRVRSTGGISAWRHLGARSRRIAAPVAEVSGTSLRHPRGRRSP